MIQNLQINGVHTDVGDELRRYVVKKIGKLDSYIPRHARQSVHAEVKLKESRAKDRKLQTCEVIMHLPQDVIATKETTMNMFAAIDIVEAKLKNQLKKYKEKHTHLRFQRRLLSRLRRKS